MEEVVPGLVKVQGIDIGSHDLKVENYSLKKGMGINKDLESESFTVGGHQWKILFYPDGRDVHANEVGDTSVYLYLTGEQSGIGSSSSRCLYEVYVVDQTGNDNHWGCSLFTHLPPQGIPCFKPSYIAGYGHFINNEILKSYLKDDCLIIRIVVGVLTSEMQPYLEVSKSYIGSDLGKLLETKQGADVIFQIGNESFPAHRCILAARSSVFESTFSGAYQKQQETIILDTDPRIFKAMLWFIYTDDLQEEKQEISVASKDLMSESFLGKMVRAADKFGVSSLKKVCESRILEMICVQGVSPLLQRANDHGDNELKVACLKFIDEVQGGYDSLQVNCHLLLSALCKGKSRPQTHAWKDTVVAVFKDYVTAVFKPIDNKRKRN